MSEATSSWLTSLLHTGLREADGLPRRTCLRIAVTCLLSPDQWTKMGRWRWRHWLQSTEVQAWEDRKTDRHSPLQWTRYSLSPISPAGWACACFCRGKGKEREKEIDVEQRSWEYKESTTTAAFACSFIHSFIRVYKKIETSIRWQLNICLSDNEAIPVSRIRTTLFSLEIEEWHRPMCCNIPAFDCCYADSPIFWYQRNTVFTSLPSNLEWISHWEK